VTGRIYRDCRLALVVLAWVWASACTATIGGSHDGGADAGSPDAYVAPVPPPLCLIDLDCGGATIPDEPKIPCMIRIEDGAGGVEYDGHVGVEKRGRSSQSFPKPQYAIELRDAAGIDSPADILAMGGEADWVLNGAYIDRALIRNKLLFELFQSFGGSERYAADIAYCELTLDGDWMGIYMLTERVKRDDDRIAISADVGSGASFILKQDDVAGLREVGIAHGWWSLVYPRAELATAGQIAGISAWLDGWQAATGGNGDIFAWLDLDSAVDFVILEELAKNNDAYFLSVHIWKDAGGLIHFTPWDLDLSFGQPLYNQSFDPHGWIMYRPPMINAMAQLPAFQSRLSARWSELRAAQLSDDAITTRLDFHLDTIADRVADNFVRWPIADIQFLDDQLYPVASYSEEITLVRQWISDRLEWMDANVATYAAGS
jgi:hypothetical protein